MADNSYMSLRTVGVDTKEFYAKAGFCISDVSRGTGICRQAMTRVPVHRATQETVQKVLEFMEEANRERCINAIEKTAKECEMAWREYLQCEDVLEKYRNEFKVERKYQRLEKSNSGCRAVVGK